MSLRDQIFAATAPPARYVDVPEWGCRVGVRSMSIDDKDSLDAEGFGKDAEARVANYRARYLVRCLVDENGELIFTPKDAAQFGRLPLATVERLFDLALEENRSRAGDVEDLKKNSETSQNGVFVSA